MSPSEIRSLYSAKLIVDLLYYYFRVKSKFSRWLLLMGKAAEHLFRLYLVTIALNAGNFKQLLARKVLVHKYGGLSMNFRVIPGLFWMKANGNR